MRLPLAGIFISTERRRVFRGVGGRLLQKHRSIGCWQAWRSIMDQRRHFLFATAHPADRKVLISDIHAPVLAIAEDVRHQLADAPCAWKKSVPLRWKNFAGIVPERVYQLAPPTSYWRLIATWDGNSTSGVTSTSSLQ